MDVAFRPFDPAAGASTERCDAARNRARVLDAAARLFAEHGVEHVSMDEVARAAGVGKGTLYRRFGDRCGLVAAVLGEREGALQEAVLRGPPPLGPGAAPRERLVAFLQALEDLAEQNGALQVEAEAATAGARYRSRLYDTYRLHVTVLLREALGRDPGPLADMLLAPLSADLLRHVRSDRGVPREEVRSALAGLVDAVLAGG